MPYAFLEGDTPVEIHAGTPFITPELVVSDDGGAYYAPKPETEGDEEIDVVPLPAGTIVKVRTTHPSNALELYTPQDLARYRIQQFAEPEAPAGKVVKTRELVVDGAGLVSVNVVFEDAPAPDAVDLLKIKVALLSAEKLEAVEEAMASAPALVRIYWQSAAIVHQSDPLAAAIAEAAGQTVVAVFRAASLVEA